MNLCDELAGAFEPHSGSVTERDRFSDADPTHRGGVVRLSAGEGHGLAGIGIQRFVDDEVKRHDQPFRNRSRSFENRP